MQMSRKAATKRREFNSTEPNGLVLNKKDLRKFKDIAYENRYVEFLYLRENEFDKFDPYIKLENLKVLDLSINNLCGAVDFLQFTPILRHLYLTGNKIDTLEGISNCPHLQTLCLSDNAIRSFEGLDGLPSLRVLSLNFNNIASFFAFPHLPALHTLNLVGNPVADIPSYRQMAIALSVPDLVSVDGQAVQPDERAAVEHFMGKVVYCIGEGFVVDADATAGAVEEAADRFLLKTQREAQAAKPLQLSSVRLVSAAAGSNVLTEGVPVQLTVCMQDIRPLEQRVSDIFHPRYLFPVIFRVSGDAAEVFVVGSMNAWADPIALERVQDEKEVYFHTTLYLPAGDYEYRYIIDGMEKVAEHNKITSKFGQGICNLYHVTEASPPEEDQDTILYIRWMRSDRQSQFLLIDDQYSLTYVPTREDIGACLRAEVLAYVRGEFSFLYFDISTPITAGVPTCTRLEIAGNPAEGDTLTVDAEYSGGNEGSSSLSWFRVLASGEEVPIEAEDPWAGYTLTLDDVGCRIRVEFTPVRDDWVAGAARSETTGVIAAGVPVCRAIKVTGEVEQDQTLTVEWQYSGGTEGESRFQWFRRDTTAAAAAGGDDDDDSFFPIHDETAPTYTPTLADVGHCLAVEYTPVSREGIIGEMCRCILDKPIEPAPPQLRAVAIKGELEEQHVLVVDFDYHGGHPGAHQIQWLRREDAKRTAKIGRPNTTTLTTTVKEVGHVIEVTVTPVRSDGVQGKPVTVATDAMIAPGHPAVKALNIVGEPAKGKVLEVVVDYFGGEPGDGIVEWAREMPETRSFDVIAKKTKKYVVQQEDVGRMLKLTYTPVRKDGVQGEPKTRLIQIPLPDEAEAGGAGAS